MVKIWSWIGLVFLSIWSFPGGAQTCPPGNPLVAPTSRYIDHLDGTITDTKTGLMWKKCSEGQLAPGCTGVATTVNWADALNGASATVYAGHDDWRLPNQHELQSLVEYGCSAPAINAAVFPNSPSVYYFSSSTFTLAPQFAFGTDFANGVELNLAKTGAQRVRLVRGE